MNDGKEFRHTYAYIYFPYVLTDGKYYGGTRSYICETFTKFGCVASTKEETEELPWELKHMADPLNQFIVLYKA